MSEFTLTTPVAFIIFNRPDTTERVFAEIAKAKPPKLLVVSDGPRASRPAEAEVVARTRAIIDRVDWECEVLTNYSDVNLGCKNRLASGLDWVFEQVEEAIILEDDCLPDPTFFRFCQEMLAKYRDDERISIVGGTNFQFGTHPTKASYYFSRYLHIWGWASWRRTWQHYDKEAAIWPELLDGGYLDSLVPNKGQQGYWQRIFTRLRAGGIDTWDYQLMLTAWSQGMVSIMPKVNMISNIGFGAEATHTKGASIFSAMATEPIDFPLVHPTIVLPDAKADAFTAKKMFPSSFARKVYLKLNAILRSAV